MIYYTDFQELKDLAEKVGIKHKGVSYERMSLFLTHIYSSYRKGRPVIVGEDKAKYYLSADFITRQKRLNILLENKLISQTERTSKYGDRYLAYFPKKLTPINHDNIITGKEILNCKVAQKEYSTEVNDYIIPSFVRTTIDIDVDTIIKVASENYPRYIIKKRRDRKIPSTLKEYVDEQIAYFYHQIYALNNDLDYYISEDFFGKRIYTSITSLSKYVRPYIRIDGEKVVELDLQSSQPTFLAKILFDHGSLEFHDFYNSVDDIYTSLGDELGINREECKIKILQWLFSNPLANYVSPYNIKLDTIFPTDAKIINEIKSTHLEGNHREKYKNIAWLLQSEENKVFRKIWTEIGELGIPFLTIHDSILVKKQDLIEAADIMVKQLSDYFQNIKVKVHTNF